MKRCILWPLLLMSLWKLHGQDSESQLLLDLLEQNLDSLGDAGKDLRAYETQIIYTQIDRDQSNKPHFTVHSFNVDDARYFYPASTVKMPTAAIALEKVNELRIKNLDRNTVILHGHGPAPQTAVLYDSTAENHLPTLAHYVKHVFVVSDNNANNRMYEFCGQKYLNEKLWSKGLSGSRIVHRIGIGGFDLESNRCTNPVSFIENNQLLYHQPLQRDSIDVIQHNKGLTALQRGKGYVGSDGQIKESPFDFSQKNFLSLTDLTSILQRILFPRAFAKHERFNITAADHEFLKMCMSIHPQESKFPAYPEKSDSYVKFFMYGDKEQAIPNHIRIFNKVGWAYGFLTDIAYIIDTKNHVEFMLSATIHTNKNKIYNDGEYEIEKIALPFFAGLGKIIYEYELKRKRKNIPNLSQFTNLSYR